MKRTPKFTPSTAGDKTAGKQPAEVSTARSPEVLHYVALPGMHPAGDPIGQGRKANTTTGVKFEQYHMWSRKARSLRNLRSARAEATVYLPGSVSTIPRSRSPPRKQPPLDATPRPSISSVLLSADAQEGRAVVNALPVRQRSISGNALLDRPPSYVVRPPSGRPCR